MKIRNSFVANSSSSSFLIAYKNFAPVLEKVEPKWIKKMVAQMMDAITKGGTTMATVEELDEYFIEQYGWGSDCTLEKIFEDDEDYREIYNNLKAALDAGLILSEVYVENDDEWSCEFFSELPYNKLKEPITLIHRPC